MECAKDTCMEDKRIMTSRMTPAQLLDRCSRFHSTLLGKAWKPATEHEQCCHNPPAAEASHPRHPSETLMRAAETS